MYAEVKHPNSDKWEPITDKPLLDCFKYFNDEFYEEFDRIKTKDVSIESLRKFADDGDYFEYTKVCSLDKFRSHYNHIIDEFNTKLKSVYAALGAPLYLDDDECYVMDSDCNEDDNNKSRSDYWFKRMTFPVNKDLMNDLAISLNNVQRAYQMLGICTSISSMVDYNDEVRLLFIVL